MMKRTVLAVLGLALAMTLATPSQAHAGVVVGLGVGPVYAGPAYGYVAVHPRPYGYYSPYAYAPGYVYPSHPYYGRFDGYRGWDHREYARRDYGRRGFYEGRGYRR